MVGVGILASCQYLAQHVSIPHEYTVFAWKGEFFTLKLRNSNLTLEYIFVLLFENAEQTHGVRSHTRSSCCFPNFYFALFRRRHYHKIPRIAARYDEVHGVFIMASSRR